MGILAAYAMGYPLESGVKSVVLLGVTVPWWRVMMAAAALPAAVQAAGMAACPESPAWLLWRGRPAEARAAYQCLHGAAFRAEEHPALGEGVSAAPLLAAAADGGISDAAQQQVGGGWAALLERRYRHAMLLAAGLPLLQQLSGINSGGRGGGAVWEMCRALHAPSHAPPVHPPTHPPLLARLPAVIFYSSAVFKRAGLGSPILGSIVMGAVNLGATLGAAALMDRAGRRPLMTLSFGGMAACLAALSAFLMLPGGRAGAWAGQGGGRGVGRACGAPTPLNPLCCAQQCANLPPRRRLQGWRLWRVPCPWALCCATWPSLPWGAAPSPSSTSQRSCPQRSWATRRCAALPLACVQAGVGKGACVRLAGSLTGCRAWPKTWQPSRRPPPPTLSRPGLWHLAQLGGLPAGGAHLPCRAARAGHWRQLRAVRAALRRLGVVHARADGGDQGPAA